MKTLNNKESIWLGLFTVLPTVLLSPLSEYFTDSDINRALISAALGGFGAAIGFGIYFVTKTKTITTKIVSIFLILILGVTTIRTFHSLNQSFFLTCEVCGYKGILNNTTECEFCGSDTWIIVKTFDDDITKKEWLKEEQIFFFSDTDDYNLKEPKELEGYKKDSKWTPSITNEDLKNQQDFEIIEDLK